jgi:mannose-1-phosphate guanylyltransferase
VEGFRYDASQSIVRMNGNVTQAVVLAGGEGTRLKPLTNTRPKPLLPVLERPCIEYSLRSLVAGGVGEIIVACGYRSRDLVEALEVIPLGVDLCFTFEDWPAGTAGAVKLLQDRLSGTFVVASGDVLADVDIGALIRFHRKHGATATMALTRVERPEEFGIVGLDMDGKINRFKEKPAEHEVFSHLINAGIYILERGVLDRVPEGRMFDFSRDLFPRLLEEGEPLYGVSLDGMWRDIGRPQDLIEANLLMAERKGGEEGIGGKALLKTSPPYSMDVQPPVYVGDDCALPSSALLSRSILESGVELGARSKIIGSLIMCRSRVGEECVIENTVIGRDCDIPSSSVLRNCVLADGTALDRPTTMVDAKMG